MTLELLFLLVCVIGSGFASGSETAVVSASRIRLHHMASQGRRGARLALGHLDQKERILAVTLVVTNVCNIAGGAIATATSEQWMGTAGSVVATVVMTCIFLVLAEIVPKAYFRYHADRMMLRVAPIWRILSWTLAPITFPAQLFARLLFRILGTAPPSLLATREEIKLVLAESGERGGLRPQEQEMLESALDYGTTIAREVMVPVSEVTLLQETERSDAFLDLVRAEGFTRLPVYRERVDQIIGLVNVYDILYDRERKSFIRTYVRPVRLIPDSKGIDDLFLEMQRERESLVVVVNEFGACIGIVTLEDIIEEIFGELSDEHEDPTPEIRQDAAGRYRVSARADIDDFNDETGMNIPKRGYETVGGYVLYQMGRVPKKGETFTDGTITVTIVDADRYSVRMVDIETADSPKETS